MYYYQPIECDYYGNENEELLFINIEIGHIMKRYLDKDKMIPNKVKVGMNRFLSHIIKEVCEEINKGMETIVEYDLLVNAIHPYMQINRINQERRDIIKQLDAIKSDCDLLSFYVKETFKSDEMEENDKIFPLAKGKKFIKQ